MSPRGATFELERFAATPITPAITLLELDGRVARLPARAGAPRLLVEDEDGRRRERAPLEARWTGERLAVSFAVPAAEVEAGDLALAVGGLLLDLPEPDPAQGSDRTVALAREVNDLRHERTAMQEAMASVEERVAAAERDANDRLVEADRVATERVAAAEERIAIAEQSADERIAAAERAGAEREAAARQEEAGRRTELEAAGAELERALAEERRAGEEREVTAAAALAALEEDRAAADDAASSEAARAAELARSERAVRAELEALERTVTRQEEQLATAGPRGRAVAEPLAAAGAVAPAESATTTVAPAEPAHDDPTDEQPAGADGRSPAPLTPPDDTGPIALRRGTVAKVEPGDPAQSETVRVLGRDRPRASALPPPPDADPGPPPGPSARTLAVVALSVAAFLVLLAILGFLL